jgi:hypothetical protein
VPLARLAGAQAVINNSGKNIMGGGSGKTKPATARVKGSKKPAKGDTKMAVTSAKKPAAKKAAAKKPAAKKAAKKPAAKKAAKKPAKKAVKKTAAKKPAKKAVKKTAAKKPVVL